MIPGFSRRQKLETMSFAATSIPKKNSIFIVKRLEILNIQRRFAVSSFLRSNHFCCSSCRADPRHYFNRVSLYSMPGASHIEVASYPSQQEIRNFNGILRTNFRRYGSRRDRSTYLIRTLQDGSDLHGRHGTTGFDVIADTQSHTHSTFMRTDTKLFDVIIFFPLASNV